jgi:hypothetical protein
LTRVKQHIEDVAASLLLIILIFNSSALTPIVQTWEGESEGVITVTTTPSVSCLIEGISVIFNGTTIIKGVTYPVITINMNTSGTCGDDIHITIVSPPLDPANETPKLKCNLINKRSVSGFLEKEYDCIAMWNYVAPPNLTKLVLKSIVEVFLTAMGIKISHIVTEITEFIWSIGTLEKELEEINISHIVTKISESIWSTETLVKELVKELEERNIVRLSVNFTLQVDSSNPINITIYAPPSKIVAILNYVIAFFIAIAINPISIPITFIPLSPLITLILTTLLILSDVTIYFLQKQAYDPISEEYKFVVEIPEPSERVKELASIYGDTIYNLYYYINYVNASAISLERAFTAYEKGDYEWYNKQLSYAKEYSEKASIYYEKLKVFLNETLPELEPYYTEETFYEGLKYVEQYRLPSNVTEILDTLGVKEYINTSEIVETAKTIGYVEAKPRELIGFALNPANITRDYIVTVEREALIPATVTITQTITMPVEHVEYTRIILMVLLLTSLPLIIIVLLKSRKHSL